MKRISAAVLALLLAVFAIACGSNAASVPTEMPAPTVEPGRVDIREGRFLRGTDLGEANFSAVLPAGWVSIDAPEVVVQGIDGGPTGIIAETGNPDLQIDWEITRANSNSLRVIAGREKTEERMVDGIPVAWVTPIEEGFDRARISVSYPYLPGDEEERFGVQLYARGIRGEELYRLVEDVLTSLRYASPPPPFSPPEPQVTPAADWQRVIAHGRDTPGVEYFSVLAPPGWEFNYLGGLDSYVGEFTNGDLDITFDFGSLAGSPDSPDMHIRYPGDEPELEFWSETIDGKPFVMFRPVSDFENREAGTGVSLDRVPGLPDVVISGTYSSAIYNCGGTFWAHLLDRDEQELVLAILRTLHAEKDSGCR